MKIRLSKRVQIIVAVAMVVTALVAYKFWNRIGFLGGYDAKYEDAYVAGSQISLEDALKAENEIKATPKDAITRMKLVAFYKVARFTDKTLTNTYVGHVQWFIRNKPEINMMESIDVFEEIDGKDNYLATQKLWMEQITDKQKNPRVLFNAACFFRIKDEAAGVELLKRAVALEPKNPEWHSSLAFDFLMRAPYAKTVSGRKELGQKSLEEYLVGYNLLKDRADKFYALSYIALAAYYAGEFEKAVDYAEFLLSEAESFKKDWNYGNAINHGNTILGLARLEKGDVYAANEYLLASGNTPGSPQLDSFGPDFKLAQALLAKGQKKQVIEYLKLCAKFWKNEIILEWIKAVESGKTPNFSVNHSYMEMK